MRRRDGHRGRRSQGRMAPRPSRSARRLSRLIARRRRYAALLLFGTALVMVLVFALALSIHAHITSSTVERPPETVAYNPSSTSEQHPPQEHKNPEVIVSDKIDKNRWNLILVNRDHPLEPSEVSFTKFGEDQQVDSRCYADLKKLMEAAHAAGFDPEVFSSYRSRDLQQTILDNVIKSYRGSGMSEEEARKEALKYIAVPGTSEHETGLAVDMTSAADVQNYENEQLPIYAWLRDHSWEYGWILRYPKDKERITGITYEPWHFRYVGMEAAREIHEGGITLEEYLGE